MMPDLPPLTALEPVDVSETVIPPGGSLQGRPITTS